MRNDTTEFKVTIVDNSGD